MRIRAGCSGGNGSRSGRNRRRYQQISEKRLELKLTILRLALYEIKYLDSIPESVSVNEAVELAKKYTIDESGFVNGILGSFIRSREGEKK